MKLLFNFILIFILQTLSPEQETFNFIIVLFGIILMIIILAYILLTSKQD